MSATRTSYNKRPKANLIFDLPVSSPSYAGELPPEYVVKTATITSAAAATAVEIVSDAQVGPGRKFYLLDVLVRVNGATAWTAGGAVFSKLTLQDSAANVFLDILLAALTGNANIFKSTANVTPNSANFMQAGGGAANKGVQIVADNLPGAGSDVVITVIGLIK